MKEDQEDFELLAAKHQKIIDQEYRRLQKRNGVQLTPDEKLATRLRKYARKMPKPDFGLEELELAEKVMESLK